MKNEYPQIILECANAHDGNYKTLMMTIKKFSRLNYPCLHIKFQPFTAETISIPTYKWFKIYQKLEFSLKQWVTLIKKSYKLFQGVWLDIFDEYSVEILEKNLRYVYGIKIQASVLKNKKIISKLSKINLKNKKIILNISGKNILEIKSIISEFELIHSKEIILQCGYQDYPTSLKETNFNKVLIIKKKFPKYRSSYADHIDSEDFLSLITPIIAISHKCSVIEKHISLKGKKSKYDNFSSLDYKKTEEMIKLVNFFLIKNKYFISKKETNYLNNSVQIPVINKNIKKNQLLNIDNISYLRTNYANNKIHDLDINKYYLAKKKINRHEALNSQNIRQAKVGIFIACRLKSNRLKNKAILKLTKEHTLIEKCILSAKKIKAVDLVAVTTSHTQEDRILKKYCQKHNVKFFAGHKTNVIKRYCDAAKKFNVDVIIRVTGDCPEISEEIVNIVLKKHININADYSVAKNCPVGYGAEIINTSSLQEVQKRKCDGNMSEYMTYYFINNPKFFKLNFVELPNWMQKKYRMTIDYTNDFNFFKELYKKFSKEKKEMNFKNLNFILKKHKYLIGINSSQKLIYKTDSKLIGQIKLASTFV
jgi:spore coat polysaccharide biosynthesis protein SpsF (cytidylyltransferase family)/sialic acid synthase SpsE